MASRQADIRRTHFDKCIFNQLESKSVFVGIKGSVPTPFEKEMIVIGSKKKMQTMP